MPKLDASQLERAYQASQSGKGLRLEGVGQLRDFAAYTRTRAAIVCNIETFEVRGEYEVARIDLSIFQGGAEDQVLPVAERITLADKALQQVLTAIEHEGIGCVFQVWVDELSRP